MKQSGIVSIDFNDILAEIHIFTQCGIYISLSHDYGAYIDINLLRFYLS